MTIKRYHANSDNTITNAYESNFVTRGTGSNMGAADILEVFSIWGQQSSGSSELSRILINFPITNITTDRSNSSIPGSGSVDFYLKLFNAPHSQTVPKNMTMLVSAVSRSWEEGTGLDMDNYTDLTYDSISGSNWMNASSSATSVTPWTNFGGDYHTDTSSSFTVDFDTGLENLELNITSLVEQWADSSGNILGSKPQYGVLIALTGSQEASSSFANIGGVPENASGAKKSYYTKKFFGRTSEFFFKRPYIEARWDSSIKDNRGNFYRSSSLASSDDNLHTLYLYNYVRGQLKNIPTRDPGTTTVNVRLYTSASGKETILTPVLSKSIAGAAVSPVNNVVTGGYAGSTGIYSATFALNTTYETVYDRWFGASETETNVYHTGSFSVKKLDSSPINPNQKYVTSIPNLKSSYSRQENARFRLFIRKKDWTPTIYTHATTEPETEIVEDVYYKVARVRDRTTVIDYGTGSLNHTRLSYDISGSHFDLDMSLFEPGYAYELNFVYYLNGAYHEQPEKFKFKVE